jgi:hypothetical protein
LSFVLVSSIKSQEGRLYHVQAGQNRQDAEPLRDNGGWDRRDPVT